MMGATLLWTVSAGVCLIFFIYCYIGHELTKKKRSKLVLKPTEQPPHDLLNIRC